MDSIEITTLVQNTILNNGWDAVAGTSFIISMGIVIAIIYAILRVKQIRAIEENYYKHQPMTVEGRITFGEEDAPAAGTAGEARWREVMRHIEADDANSWRQAIMEADIMLDDVVTNLGYTGDGVGEKMKQIARSDVNTIDDAWEAHKVRNRIAHDGSDFNISHRDARRVINLYEGVFKELGYIG